MDGYSLWEQILMACFGGDAARLRSLLAHPDCTPALLASPDPITALHAAAVGGSAGGSRCSVFVTEPQPGSTHAV